MGRLSSLFRREPQPVPVPRCLHETFSVVGQPSWDSGETPPATNYACDGCGEQFSRAAAVHLQAAAVARREAIEQGVPVDSWKLPSPGSRVPRWD